MAGRSRTLLVLAAVVAVALAGCSARGEAATVDAPAWHAGYTWSHNGTIQYVFEEAFGEERENGTGEARFTRTERVVNTGFDADGEPAYLTVQHLRVLDDEHVGLPTVPVLAAYRQSDLKPLEVEGLRRESCSDRGPCSGALEGVAFEDEAPDNLWLPFPIRTGDTWGGTYDVFGGEIEMRYTAEAGRMRTVQTPVGPVEAMRIEVHHRPTNLEEAMREFREEAREDGYPIEDLRIDLRVDGVYHYSPAYETVVQSVQTGRESFSATIPDGEGGRIQARSESRFEERSVLAGARLVAGPELSLAEVADLLAPDGDLGDVAGVPVPEATYRLAVSAVDAEVNALAGEAGRFEARLDGVEALPEGHALRWILLSGPVAVATAEGDAFEPRPETPGRYAVVLEAVDGAGDVVASAGSGLVAHYEGTLDLDCGPVSVRAPLVQMETCIGQPLPVHPGVRAVHLVATPAGPLPNPTTELDVRDAIGRPVPVRQEGGSFVVDLEVFDGLNVDAEPWVATWGALVGVLEGATMQVRIDYGSAPAPAAVEARVGYLPVGHRLPAWLA